MQRGEVVHVVGQVRNVRQTVSLPMRSRKASMCSRSSAAISRKSARLSYRAARRAAGSPDRRRSASAAARRPVGASSPNDGCTRLTMSAWTDWPASASRCAKNVASCMASRRGEVTSTNAVSGSPRRSPTTARPLPEAFLHALEGPEERDDVLDHLGADDAATVRRNVCTATLATRRYGASASSASGTRDCRAGA